MLFRAGYEPPGHAFDATIAKFDATCSISPSELATTLPHDVPIVV